MCKYLRPMDKVELDFEPIVKLSNDRFWLQKHKCDYSKGKAGFGFSTIVKPLTGHIPRLRRKFLQL